MYLLILFTIYSLYEAYDSILNKFMQCNDINIIDYNYFFYDLRYNIETLFTSRETLANISFY